MEIILIGAHQDCHAVIYPHDDKPSTFFIRLVAESNLVIVELLIRQIEMCRPTTPTFVTSFMGDKLFPDEALYSDIIEALGLADILLNRPDTPILNGHDRESNIARFNSFSQKVRNELSNRDKARRNRP